MTSIFENKKLCVFDFDETLISSPDHKIKVVKKTGETLFLNSEAWNRYTPNATDTFDFSSLEKASNIKIIEKTWKVFLERLGALGFESVHILSARGSRSPVEKFFSSQGIKVQISCLGIAPGENNGYHKALWVENKIKNENISVVEFFDDREDCVASIMELSTKYQGVDFYVWKITDGKPVPATRKDLTSLPQV
mgnify:CR=1 FL=1